MNFLEKLEAAIVRSHSLLCVGLDPDPALMPWGKSIADFNRAIVEATADLVCAYKPNIAFYEAQGTDGLKALEETRKFIPDGIPVILDAKRGDIGNTARAYAQSLFDYFGADAVTVNPYLGYDALEPFFERRDRGVFVLCRTSNRGAADFQSLIVADGGKRLFEVVAARVAEWNRHGNLGLVMGATYPEELKMIRQKYPEIPLLIPGVGAQGGELELVVKYGMDMAKRRTIINSSRQVLYASSGDDFALAARRAAGELRDKINRILSGMEGDSF
ncbi:MAG: orotidine-5'-phosphate decarboxylase [Dehalococcoidales bacterium]|nr:orotidine-5'-phosphate decarboxylase [Dehalococcoidales bacterium]